MHSWAVVKKKSSESSEADDKLMHGGTALTALTTKTIIKLTNVHHDGLYFQRWFESLNPECVCGSSKNQSVTTFPKLNKL